MTYLRDPYLSLLATGQETVPRQWAGTTSALSSGNMRTALFNARKSETSTQVRFIVQTAAAGGSSGVTLVYLALYTVADDNAMTRVAVTANEATILNSPGLKTVSWASSYNMVNGRRYALGLTATYDSATAPVTWVGTAPGSGEAIAVPAVAALLGTTAGVPSASYSAATVNASTANAAPYAVILP